MKISGPLSSAKSTNDSDSDYGVDSGKYASDSTFIWEEVGLGVRVGVMRALEERLGVGPGLLGDYSWSGCLRFKLPFLDDMFQQLIRI